jgi:hypothetical protein
MKMDRIDKIAYIVILAAWVIGIGGLILICLLLEGGS